MIYNFLGNTGLKVSNLSLGTMAFGRWIDEKESDRIIDAALDSGINVIDTANFYGKGQDEAFRYGTGASEEIIGRALQGRRDKIVLATKVGLPMGRGVNEQGLSKKHILKQAEDSLSRLKTDYIDLYQVHRFDENTPLEETLEALTTLVEQGKVRYIGCSNFAAWQIEKSRKISKLDRLVSFVSSQSQYNLLSREAEQELIPYCLSENVGLLVYSPLARGMLTGKYASGADYPAGSRAANGEKLIFQYINDDNFKRVAKYQEIAKRYEKKMPQFALSWILNQPAVTTAILGASKVQHVTDAAAISDWKWDTELIQEVNNI
ncbi:aldo/keto reductase [Sporolactobacillus pectinivorans]|uniref:aldo/keto reductase n=1 Tax=Sporolactobacillus pectinivorans TaxID=1591408 RepID=UPI000C26510E|nr:aldo/keto reductase [Sporolactobacillus pectinivorans]